MIVKEIITAWLTEKGFDGLFNIHAECGCLLDNLAPCGEMAEECQPGFKKPCDCEGTPCNFHVTATK